MKSYLSLSASMDTPLTLARSTEGFVLSAKGYEDVHINETEITRSKTLLHSFHASEVGDYVPLGIDRSMLMDWRAFASQQPATDCPDIPKLVRVLQAADFLNDSKTVQRASHDLAILAFPVNPSGTTDGQAGQGEVARSSTTPMTPADLNALESLPEHLAVLAVRTAFTTDFKPPLLIDRINETRYSDDNDYAEPALRRTQAIVLALMEILPERMHALPFLAQCAAPQSRDVHALTLHFPELCTPSGTAAALAAAAAAAAAGPPASGLTSLSITNGRRWRTARNSKDDVVSGCDEMTSNLRHAIAHLATMMSPMHLSIEVERQRERVSAESDETWADAFWATLCNVVPDLTQVTSLRVHAINLRARTVQAVAPGLSALTGLRALDLSHNRLTTRYDGEPRLRAFAEELRRLTALTRLSLEATCLGDGGWGIIESAAAELPLQALDLRHCNLAYTSAIGRAEGVDLEPAAAGGPEHVLSPNGNELEASEAPFAGLQSLLLGDNILLRGNTRGFVAHVAHLTRLTELSLMLASHGAAPHTALLHSICAPELAKFSVSFPQEYREMGEGEFIPGIEELPDSVWEDMAAAFGGVLARSPLLESVTVRAMYHCAASVTQVLTGLAGVPGLKHLDVFWPGPPQHMQVSGRDVQEHASALAQCGGLTELSIRCSEVRVMHAFPSLTALQALCVEMKGLASSDRDLSVGLAMLEPLVDLTRLHLSGTCFVAAADAVARVLQCMTLLCELSLNAVSTASYTAVRIITDTGVNMVDLNRHDVERRSNGSLAPVIAVLPELQALTKVDLRLLEIRRQDVSALVGVLPQLDRLRLLGVGIQVHAASRNALVAAAPPGLDVILYENHTHRRIV